MSEQLLLELFGVLSAGILLLGTIWKGSSLIITNLENRTQRLTDELIVAKTKALQEKVDNLTTKLNKTTEDLAALKEQADQLRRDLDAEKAARLSESKRAARAEYLEANARRELEKAQIEVETLKSVLKMLSVTVPEGTVQINVVRSPEQQISTDELTETVKKVAEQINGEEQNGE